MPTETNTDAIANERLRLTAILESAEGLAHPEAAREMALRSSMQPDQVCAILAKLPEENPFQTLMDREGPIGVRAAAATTFAPGGDAKATRLAELQAAGRAHSVGKGYVTARPPAHSDK